MIRIIFLLIFSGILFVASGLQAEVYTEVWSEASQYREGEFEVGIFASIEEEVFSDWVGYFSVQITGGSVERSGADIFTRDGNQPIVSVRQWYVSSDSWRVGKQTFPDEASVKFDFVSLNLFETRDLRPFLALDEERRLGNWGVSKSLLDGKLKLVAALVEPPTIAMDEDNPWTRQLPKGFHYGDIDTKADYLVGARWGDDIGEVKYDVYIQNGAGNSPVDVNISKAGEVKPMISKQTAVSLAIQKPIGEFNLRLGLAGYLQEDYSDFTVGVVELESIWENIIADGDSLFVDVGYADAWETASGEGIPELDIRRIYEGGTALVTAEYALSDWVLKIKGAYNFSKKGMYIAPEISWFASDSIEMSLRYEAIDGRGDSSPNSIWAEHSKDDNVTIKLIWTF